MQTNDHYPVRTRLGVKPLVVVPEDIPRVLGEVPRSREDCQKSADKATEELKRTLTAGVKVLKPAVIETRVDVEGLKEDVGHADLYWVSGVVAVRQRPPTAKGFVFVTLEDEGGTMNVIIKPPVFEQQHQIWSRGLVLLVEGTVEREGACCNVMAERAWRLA